jgi:aryl-alcohol dehydrogenase-like predicted oxidoreductase
MAVPALPLGSSGLAVSAVGLGCMNFSGGYGAADDATSAAAIRHALDVGVTHFDTSDIYGHGHSERLLGTALAGRRDEAVIATKFGYVADPGARHGRTQDCSPAHARAALDASLQRLGTDHIDLWYAHRTDPAVPIEETVGAMAEAVQAGKVRFLGLSEAHPVDIRRGHAVHPLAAVQREYSLFERGVEAEVLPLCRELGIGFVAFSPLGRGVLGGQLRGPADYEAGDMRAAGRFPRVAAEHLAANAARVRTVEAVGLRHGATTAQVALAWLLAQGVAVIPGTRTADRIAENAGAAAVAAALTPADLAELAAVEPAAGDRYPNGDDPATTVSPYPRR